MQCRVPILAVDTIALCLTWIAIASAAPFVYVTNHDDDSVSVIDTATNTEVDVDGNSANGITRIPVQDEPVSIVVHPNGKRVYVGNHSLSNSVSVIDTITHTVIATVPVGQQPIAL